MLSMWVGEVTASNFNVVESMGKDQFESIFM